MPGANIAPSISYENNPAGAAFRRGYLEGKIQLAGLYFS